MRFFAILVLLVGFSVGVGRSWQAYGAASQSNRLYACLNVTTGQLEPNTVRAYTPHCPTSADQVIHWSISGSRP